MADNHELLVTVNLAIKTHCCGAVYAVPNWLGPYDYKCPICSVRAQCIIESEKDDLRIEVDHLKHVVAGLRGAGRK